MIQVEIVERCITDLNYRFKHYSDYILGALCLIGVSIGVLLVSKVIRKNLKFFLKANKLFCRTLS